MRTPGATRPGEGGRPGIGLPTWITLGRGFAGMLLVGWVVLPAPSVRAAWMAVALFLVAALGDLLDGWLARRLGQVTELGRRLDGAVDALAMLVGVSVAVRWGRLPAGFLVLGLAPYLFLLFLAGLRRLGRLPYPLPYRLSRRLAGAVLFAWVAFALSPLPYPPWWWVGHALVVAVVGASFLLDGWVSLGGGVPAAPDGVRP